MLSDTAAFIYSMLARISTGLALTNIFFRGLEGIIHEMILTLWFILHGFDFAVLEAEPHKA